MDQDKIQDDVIISQNGCVGLITLNRERALNALTLDMIREIRFALDKWQKDNAVKVIYIDGAGERAFCAGGDIKNFYRIGMDYRRGSVSFDVAMLFFKEEYSLNEVLHSYPKPIISHMHGITMGGGYGVAGNVKYRLVTSDTIFAMPEVKIGFFPDVGSMYHLTKVPDSRGLYLALSGGVVKSGDMLKLGLADYHLEKDDKGALIEKLDVALRDKTDSHQAVREILDEICAYESDQALYTDSFWEDISAVFGQQDVVTIVTSVRNGDLGADIKRDMDKNSPFSMTFAFAYFNYCKGKSFADVIHGDFDVCASFAKQSEFYEGIRAAVVDKDKAPVWQNDDVSSVSYQAISEYLARIKQE